jgi:transposase-like protein
VVVPQHQLNTFLASAEDLEILGLSKKCANIHIGADLEDYDLGPLELPSRRNKRLKRKRDKAAAASSAETYEEPEIKQENGFDEAGGEKLLMKYHYCWYLAGAFCFVSPFPTSARNLPFLKQVKREKRGGEQLSGDRMYECESCNKKFARKAHLQRHEKAHSDFRPFVCTICEQKFKVSRKVPLSRKILLLEIFSP